MAMHGNAELAKEKRGLEAGAQLMIILLLHPGFVLETKVQDCEKRRCEA